MVLQNKAVYLHIELSQKLKFTIMLKDTTKFEKAILIACIIYFGYHLIRIIIINI